MPIASRLLSYSNGKLLVVGSYSVPVGSLSRNVTLFRTEEFQHTPALPPFDGGGLQSPPDPTHGDGIGNLAGRLESADDEELAWETLFQSESERFVLEEQMISGPE